MSRRTIHNKLVRDGIPALIAANGGQAVTRRLDAAAYEAALRTKLQEEAAEAAAASGTQLLDELGDLLEVIDALAVSHGFSHSEIKTQQTKKQTTHGNFSQRIWLEWTEDPTTESPT